MIIYSHTPTHSLFFLLEHFIGEDTLLLRCLAPTTYHLIEKRSHAKQLS